MAFLTVGGSCIKGLVTAVPERVVSIDDEKELFDNKAAQVERLKKTLGLENRRVVEEGTTACDLALAACEALIMETGVKASEIDAVFMVTQTPDYLQPGNAILLQDRLKLPTTCAAMDINLGCSGFIYGLWAVQSFLAGMNASKAILVVGDTISRIVSPKDRSLRPLFGDGACAVLLEKSLEASETYYEFRTDGSGFQSLWQPGGGFRERPSTETMKPVKDGEGIIRSRCDLHMDGADIFNFSLKVVPEAIRDMLEQCGWAADAIDGFVLHQANRYILDNIRRKLSLPSDLVPSATCERFGNQSSASIPATLTDHYGELLKKSEHRFILCGFGVGLSWATCAIEIPPLKCNSLVEI